MKLAGARATLLALPLLLASCAPALGGMRGATESVVLPNGELCGFAGEGATLAFGGQRLAWTCDVAPTGPRGLLGAPVVVRDTDVDWRLGTAARRADGAGFELGRLETVGGRVLDLELATGERCAFSGEGATLAFGGRRVNYTCGDDVVLVGALVGDELGLLATRGALARTAAGLELRRERQVRVRSVVLGSAVGGQPDGAPHAPLFGTTWALERIRFGDGVELTPPDPSGYTLTLGADASVALQADCNRAAGRFDLDGERLSFAPFASTRAACPPGSLDQTYLTQLGSAVSYRFADGRLVVATGIDASLLYFQPLP
jgi:heat shock protein HslJ